MYCVICLHKSTYKVCYDESGGVPFLGTRDQASELKSTLEDDHPETYYSIYKLTKED